MSAERTLDRLLPQALALLLAIFALAAGIGGVAADAVIGRPSSTSAVGIGLLIPIVLLAAVVGFAIGSALGEVLRRRGMAPSVPMTRYRLATSAALLAAAIAGGLVGATPVIRHERRHQPRVIVGQGLFDRQPGAACDAPRPAALVCQPGSPVSSSPLVWNARDVSIACTSDGRILVNGQTGEVVASADLSDFEYMRDVYAAPARQADGREALAIFARLRMTDRREMFLVVDADGRIIYQELLERQERGPLETPLFVCSADDRESIVIDAGTRVTYRPN